MAITSNENMTQTIFNEIIRTRVSDYINKELDTLIKQKVDSIVTSVLSDLQLDIDVYKDMLRYESKLVVQAIYNGKDINKPNSKE